MPRVPTRVERTEKDDKKSSFPPDKLRNASKSDRSQSQKVRWERVETRSLKSLHEEFGHTPFSLEEADECGYLDTEEIETKPIMDRLVRRGWYEVRDEEYILTQEGHDEYEGVVLS